MSEVARFMWGKATEQTSPPPNPIEVDIPLPIREALQAAQKERDRALAALREAEEAQSRLIAAAGHDLMQPLRAARMSMESLADLQSDLDGKMLAGQVCRALDSMTQLVSTIVEIGRIDAGCVSMAPKPVELDGLFQSIASDFAPIVARKGLSLRARSTDLVAMTDEGCLKRVLHNLVANAVRYTHDGGVLLSARPRGDRIRIDVIDTGPGIPDEERELIFEAFTRASTCRGEEGGLGLGLAMVKRLSKALDLGIAMRSRPGRGTTFSLFVEEAAG